MKLFVDDERPAPPGWVLALTSHQALDVLHGLHRRGEILEALSLDHDLAIVDGVEDDTRGIVIQMCGGDLPWPTELYVHTANPPAESWLVGMILRYAPEGTLVGYGANYWGTVPGSSVVRLKPSQYRP